MKALPGKIQVVDMATGEVTEDREASCGLMPPALDACHVCGHRPAHGSDEPHNAQSLYYQYAFYADNGRWPTWRDAIAHCSTPVREGWEAELRRRGVWPAEEVAK
ncbi:hypothetical protein EN904_12235 [Mesorhizobium sp. M7A.F.Ca.CA.001.07.2.1]|uniref:hypothetical protein n=1 Tax=Mesorhizobium TaxID=68287 RepID=UPI000FCAC247|nr:MULTISPECIES: hypothetical protein [Mesorhizobium]RVB26107.1 hypothetical protein EN918_26360 [Mesorhizobium sp. M7A.F.Ca.CA.004.05.1.1]MCF6126040.1 hypothetical protein [Mesorhizobium ciceri]MCQ8813925.1 hypothetical protein [Mesorhizobium sp. SEMIA396]RUX81423.1 hypothetical protein EN983_04580 [Mesorhizobium sp. M7A.F.Ca.CA.004.08.2.1]RUX89447.1 hypothetical protein EN982_02610 [Mesorhizobium sp. M7A.F.Ca.CA.004.08.1.1]